MHTHTLKKNDFPDTTVFPHATELTMLQTGTKSSVPFFTHLTHLFSDILKR